MKDPPSQAEEREVRAGPGDAGRQDRPEPLPRDSGDKRRGRHATRLLLALLAIGLVVWLLTWFAV